jgi:hypothetical protein
VLFAGKDRTRLAAVRVQFKGGDRHRDYLVAYEPGRSNNRVKRAGSIQALSFADAGAGKLDLRKKSDAAKVEKLLARLDLDGGKG